MAFAFKNFKQADLDNADEVIYTVPPNTTAIVLMLQATNIDGVNAVTASLWWTDDSDTDAVTYLLKTTSIAVGQAKGAVDGKLVLEAGDQIKGLAGADGDVSVSGSVLELS